MARVLNSRNIILSLVKYLTPYISGNGYSFTFVKAWRPDSDVVLPKDYDATKKQNVLPAGKVTVTGNTKTGYVEIGNKQKYNNRFVNIFIHAVTEGQLYDLLDLIDITLDNADYLGIYDFTSTGYPSDAAPVTYMMEIRDITQRTFFDVSNPNAALRYGGLVSFVGRIIGFDSVTTTSTTTTP